MAHTDQTDQARDREERNCREILARSLVATLGREGAVHACRANGWDGVLAYVPVESRDTGAQPWNPADRLSVMAKRRAA